MSPPSKPTHDDPLDRLVDAFTAFFETLGLRPSTAKVWAVVYLAPAPIGQDEIRKLTGLSLGMVSDALRELDGFDALAIEPVPGSRRRHYTPHGDLLGTVRRALRRRDEDALGRLRAAVRETRDAYTPALGAALLDQRLAGLEQATALHSALLDLVDRVSAWTGSAAATFLPALERPTPRPEKP